MSNHLLDVWHDVTTGLSATERSRASALLIGNLLARVNTALIREDVVRDMRAAVDSTINARQAVAS